MIVDFDYERAFATVYQLNPFFDEAYVSAKRLLQDPRIMSAVCQEIHAQARYITITRDMIANRLFQISIDPKTKIPDQLRALDQLSKAGFSFSL